MSLPNTEVVRIWTDERITTFYKSLEDETHGLTEKEIVEKENQIAMEINEDRVI